MFSVATPVCGLSVLVGVAGVGALFGAFIASYGSAHCMGSDFGASVVVASSCLSAKAIA